MALPWLFEFWAHPHQLPPEGAWKTWVILGGRGAGKTRAGAEWVRSQVEGPRRLDPGAARKVALVSETLDQARDVMVFGESGILACAPPDRKPEWQATRRRLVWPNGAEAQIFSASDPESLRGPQFDAAWVDELAKWKKASATWDQLQFALRLGETPRQVVTTTPRNVPLLHEILGRDSTMVTQAPTEANRAFLAKGFIEELAAAYQGSRFAREELWGELLTDMPGALWNRAALDSCHRDAPVQLDRVVVAIDPPVSSGENADTCGIIVVGAQLQGPQQDWRAFVLEDASVQGQSPQGWARAAVAAYHRHGADRIVAEVNQGGDMVGEMVAQVDPAAAFAPVRATRGKVARAEPISALYEQGRVFHADWFRALEDQMCEMAVGGFQGRGSPDRVDALVWGLTDLMLGKAAHGAPRIRQL